VVLISQCASQLPKCVRTMMEQTIVCKKLRAVGLNQYYSAVTYEGPQAIDDARESAKLHSEKGKYTRAVYQFYQSHSQAGGNAGHIEAGGGANVLLGSVGRYVGIMLVVGGVGLYFLVSNPLVSSALGGSDEQGEREDESRQAGGAAAAATAPAPPARELRPRAPAAGEASMSSWLPDEAITASWHTGARCGVVTVSGTRKQGRGADCQALEFVELADGSAAVEGDQGSAFDGFGLAVR
jgi:zona occludens toxin (predicted ATPase)